MPSIRNRNRTGSSAAARWRWRLTAGLATPLAALGLATALTTAAYADPPPAPPPGPGLTPGVAFAPSGGPLSAFYTAADQTVWTGPAGTPGGPFTQISNGRLISGPAAILAPPANDVVFGQGTDHALWFAVESGGTWSFWGSLGGNITSKPGAVFRGPLSSDYSVYARGTDGAVWGRDHFSTGWGSWHSLGGSLYGGTGPAAAFISGSTWLLAVGTNRALYIQRVGTGVWSNVGGQTTVAPGLAALPDSLVGFVRGTNGGAYYHRFLAGAQAGWQPMGGVFSSGLSATNSGFASYTLGLGTDSQVYRNTGTWTSTPSKPPVFSGWGKVTG